MRGLIGMIAVIMRAARHADWAGRRARSALAR
jgi:hypothetical protein